MDEVKTTSPLSRLWSWAGPYHGAFYGSIALAILGVACSMVPYFAIAGLLAALLGGETDPRALLLFCGIALAGYAGKILFSSLSTAISHTATFHTLRDLRLALTRKLAAVPMGTVLDTPSGRYKTTIVDRVEGMEPTFAHLIPEMTSNVLIPLAMISYLVFLDWRMALISILTTVVGLVVMALGMRTYPAKWAGAVEAGQRMANAIVEYIGGIKVVKAFARSAGSYAAYADAVNYNANYYVDWMRENQKTMCVYQAVIPATLLFVLPFGLLFWSQGTLDTATFLTIAILAVGVTGPIMAAFTFTDDIAALGTNVGEIAAVLDSPELKRPDCAAQLSGRRIELDHVSFSYQGAAKEDQDDLPRGDVLHDISLSIEPGTVTALVGPSGSGKSTIARLIAGFWDVDGGAIRLGGVDVRDMPLDQLSSQIAYVSQDNYLFDETVRENIRMGRAGATDADVEAVAKAAGCDDFIRALEEGYDTRVGTSGSQISGGERQRISIARAMLKAAPIVILDEATASIDPENEAFIQHALSALISDKTLIVIAHRLSTITDADTIVVVSEGRIAGSGPHKDLLKTCPLYERMWTAHLDARDEREPVDTATPNSATADAMPADGPATSHTAPDSTTPTVRSHTKEGL